MADLVGFTQKDAERIKRTVNAYENGRCTPGYIGIATSPASPVEVWVALTNEIINAMSGVTPAHGSANLISLNLGTGDLQDQGISIDLYNIGAEIPSNTYILAQRDPISGQYLTDFPGVMSLTVLVPPISCISGSIVASTVTLTGSFTINS